MNRRTRSKTAGIFICLFLLTGCGVQSTSTHKERIALATRDPAVECFESITDELLYATPEKPYCNMGWAYLEKEKYRKAKKNFKKALDIKPDFINAIHGLATTNLKTEQAHLSLTLLKKVVKENPEIAVLHYDLAKSYEATGQGEKAKPSWKAVIQFAPDSDLAREAEMHL
ncbi:MAG: tetratricopeptide repeat protein [Thermodesulfobacteriota bacterium]|nr:tetratricopeptide repeat protein [Thermodesulfobacteriota bacterium]